MLWQKHLYEKKIIRTPSKKNIHDFTDFCWTWKLESNELNLRENATFHSGIDAEFLITANQQRQSKLSMFCTQSHKAETDL